MKETKFKALSTASKMMRSPLQRNGLQEIYFDPDNPRRKFNYPDPPPSSMLVTPPTSPQSPPTLSCITTGQLQLSDGRKFHGNHVNGRLIFGVMTYPDGTRYEGAWVDGQREGHGCCDFPDGSRYEGDFHKGDFHGHGQLVWSDGGFYDGDFVQGVMEGEGMEVRGDGTLRHDGLWRKGLPVQVTTFDPTESERWRPAHRLHPPAMPKQIFEIKEFLLTARRKDAKAVKIKKTGGITKFKVRCSRYLYTLAVTDNDKADKLKHSLPPNLKVSEIGKPQKKAANKK